MNDDDPIVAAIKRIGDLASKKNLTFAPDENLNEFLKSTYSEYNKVFLGNEIRNETIEANDGDNFVSEAEKILHNRHLAIWAVCQISSIAFTDACKRGHIYRREEIAFSRKIQAEIDQIKRFNTAHDFLVENQKHKDQIESTFSKWFNDKIVPEVCQKAKHDQTAICTDLKEHFLFLTNHFKELHLIQNSWMKRLHEERGNLQEEAHNAQKRTIITYHQCGDYKISKELATGEFMDLAESLGKTLANSSRQTRYADAAASVATTTARGRV